MSIKKPAPLVQNPHFTAAAAMLVMMFPDYVESPAKLAEILVNAKNQKQAPAAAASTSKPGPSASSQVLRYPAVARVVGCSVNTVRNMVSAKELPCVVLKRDRRGNPTMVGVPQAALEAHIAKNTRQG